MEKADIIIERLKKLEDENQVLKVWQSEMTELVSKLLEMIEKQNDEKDDIQKQLATINTFIKINRYRIDSLPYELAAPDYQIDNIYPNILSITETRELIVKEKNQLRDLGMANLQLL